MAWPSSEAKLWSIMSARTFAEISMIMGISVNTANNHVKSAMFKLRTPNRAAAVFRAAMLGLLN
jgi:DNA-binding CsgD family transcriptional regulator